MNYKKQRLNCSHLSGEYGTEDDYIKVSVLESVLGSNDGRGDIILHWAGHSDCSPEQKDFSYFQSTLHDSLLANSELQEIPPEDIGALTDGLLLGIADEDEDGNITEVVALWWHTEYMLESESEAICSPEGLRLYRFK